MTDVKKMTFLNGSNHVISYPLMAIYPNCMFELYSSSFLSIFTRLKTVTLIIRLLSLLVKLITSQY